MKDYDVGHSRPPIQSRFKRGVSGNPAGRPKRKAPDLSEIIKAVLHAPASYRENGKQKRAPRVELAIRSHVKRALGGDVKSAAALLEMRAHAQRYGDGAVRRLLVSNWLPDAPGQTGEKKTQEQSSQTETSSAQWWIVKEDGAAIDMKSSNEESR